MSRWLVTGGAGYIGSHVVKELVERGMSAVVVDNLSTGRADAVPRGVPLVPLDVRETLRLAGVMTQYRVTGVVHLAGFKAAGVSVVKPLLAYGENVTGVLSVLRAMEDAHVNSLVFSSSAAVYRPGGDLREDSPLAPESPYGETKMVGEMMIRSAVTARPALRATSLRYFNVVGSGGHPLRDDSAHNLFPIAMRNISAGESVTIYGTGYPTGDGTCVRDYVHVEDLARAHVLAATQIDSFPPVVNLGSGVGHSVWEVVSEIIAQNPTSELAGVVFGSARPGDPAHVVADISLARSLGWQPTFSLSEMVSSAWTAHIDGALG